MVSRLLVPWRVALAYAVTCAALWPWPVLGLLHVESSAVIATVGFFASAWSVCGRSRRVLAERATLRRLYGEHLAVTLLPLALLLASLPWRPNCDYVRGIGFFALFVLPSVVLGVSAGLLSLTVARRWRALAIAGGGLAVALSGVAFDLGLHPQFYTYSHIFGGVLGPIYDEALVMRSGLFAAKGLTLAWAGALALAARRIDGRGARWALPLLLVGIGCAYAFRGPLGINTPRAHAERVLGGHLATAHFDVYYAPTSLDARAARRVALDHEFAYARLAAILGTEPPGQRVASYLYPDADTKAALTGARVTSVAPVWLGTPQMHVALPDLPRVLDHELAHAFSKAFGGPLDASVSVGLVEGLAVAVEPPDGAPPPREQIAALLGGPRGDAVGAGLANALSPLGFWTGRGAASYTTMGAFVSDLLAHEAPEALHTAYPWAQFERAYGVPADTLVAVWRARIGTAPVIARAAAPIARRRFARPSLFEKPCPHYVPPFRRALAEADDALARYDTEASEGAVARALAERPDHPAALDRWARLRLDEGDAERATHRLAPLAADTLASPALLLRYADALAQSSQPEAARRAYDRATERLAFHATASRAIIALRRALAGQPSTIAALTQIAPDSVRADALAALYVRGGSDAHEAAVAQRWLEALLRIDSDPARAAALLAGDAVPLPDSDSIYAPDLRALLHRQRLAWRAEALATAEHTDAARAYLIAAAAFDSVGDAHPAALLRHRAARAAFAEHHALRF